MNLPLIGITAACLSDSAGAAKITLNEVYIRAVARGGGAPLIIPPTLSETALESIFSRLDGVLFSGGGDVETSRYHGIDHPRVYGVDPERDRVEIYLVEQAARRGLPFLGICRGIQVINVALGGTLYTHIHDQHPDALRHDWYPNIPRDHLAHPVKVQESSSLYRILGKTTVETNSLHHQAIHQSAPRLTAVAWAPDGIIEAVELSDHPFGLGVQWHPENLQAYPEMRALFQALVAASRQA
jgi:putative glutamine amidotransferase